MSSKSIEERFWEKVDIRSDDECWLWTGAVYPNGYGRFWLSDSRRGALAHRVAYEITLGSIPDGLVIDHVKKRGCTSKACVNPRHLEPVPQVVNVRRGRAGQHQAVKTHCPQGHAYNEVNTRHYRGRRYCRPCIDIDALRRRGKANSVAPHKAS